MVDKKLRKEKAVARGWHKFKRVLVKVLCLLCLEWVKGDREWKLKIRQYDTVSGKGYELETLFPKLISKR